VGDREAVERPLTPEAGLRGDVPVIDAGPTAAAAHPCPARAMREVKAELDPLGILDPGKVLPDGA